MGNRTDKVKRARGSIKVESWASPAREMFTTAMQRVETLTERIAALESTIERERVRAEAIVLQGRVTGTAGTEVVIISLPLGAEFELQHLAIGRQGDAGATTVEIWLGSALSGAPLCAIDIPAGAEVAPVVTPIPSLNIRADIVAVIGSAALDSVYSVAAYGRLYDTEPTKPPRK